MGSSRSSKRSYSQYDEATVTSTSHSAFATSSASTRRRRRVRRMRSNNRTVEELEVLSNMFQHVELVERAEPYGQLNAELVVAEPDNLVVKFSQEHPPPINNFDPQEWTFVKACTPVEMAHLRYFDRAPNTPANQFAAVIETCAEHVASLLSLPDYLYFPHKEDLAQVRYIGYKFGGIEYAAIGLKSRAEANPIAQVDAEQAWDELMSGKRVQPHDVRLGGRGKVTKMLKEDAASRVPAVGRLILMMSQRDLKLCGVTENQLTAAYSAPEYPIAVGQSWFHGGAQDFIDRFMPYDEYFCFDAKKFDSSIDPWMVRLGINILRRQYLDGLDPKYDSYWDFVAESLLSPVIYRDDGIRMHKWVGTTSGHSHNTLLQSIITLLIGYVAFMWLHPELNMGEILNNMWIESLGDDNVTGVKGPLVGHSVEEISEVVNGVFHVDWFGKKSFSTTRLLDIVEGEFQGMQFLGKFFRVAEYDTGVTVEDVVLPYRPAQETYLRLLYPEYGDRTATAAWLRVLGNYLDAAGNTAMEAWLQDYMEWLEPQVEDVPLEWPPNYQRMVSRDYSHLGIEVPHPTRIGFDQWRDLVVMRREEYRNVWVSGTGEALF